MNPAFVREPVFRPDRAFVEFPLKRRFFDLAFELRVRFRSLRQALPIKTPAACFFVFEIRNSPSGKAQGLVIGNCLFTVAPRVTLWSAGTSSKRRRMPGENPQPDRDCCAKEIARTINSAAARPLRRCLWAAIRLDWRRRHRFNGPMVQFRKFFVTLSRHCFCNG
jgi:hypothetical protein